MGGGPRLHKRKVTLAKRLLVSDESLFNEICAGKIKDLHERARARGYWSLDELVERLQMLRLQHGGGSHIRGSIYIMPTDMKENGVQVVLEYQYLEKFNMERLRRSYGRRTRESINAKDDPPDPRAPEEKR